MVTLLNHPPGSRDEDATLHLNDPPEQIPLAFSNDDVHVEDTHRNSIAAGHTSNFINNLRLPVHRWFRYSAGFSAEWVKWLLIDRKAVDIRVLDPFVGSGTTCLACADTVILHYHTFSFFF